MSTTTSTNGQSTTHDTSHATTRDTSRATTRDSAPARVAPFSERDHADDDLVSVKIPFALKRRLKAVRDNLESFSGSPRSLDHYVAVALKIGVEKLEALPAPTDPLAGL